MITALRESIKRGIEYSSNDYKALSERECRDVKPKEDQLKCALYRSLAEDGYLMHVEARNFHGNSRIDLLGYKGKRTFAIEIKTSWCATGWANKYAEQRGKWISDIDRVSVLLRDGHIDFGFFVLALAYQEGY
ncbi:hypothetical protein [Niveispirillum sp. KHB5.9]|uniref:hypothetical protein n=1 Tax=Niveispirillum sp. KHB5.9 TaxID=3400269 RepID=UPI003A84DE0A